MMNGWPVTAARLLSEVLYGRFRVAELGRGARKRESDKDGCCAAHQCSAHQQPCENQQDVGGGGVFCLCDDLSLLA